MAQFQAVIFDIDGTLIDNNDYHFQAWKKYLQNIGRDITDDEFKEKISGRTNDDAVAQIFGRQMSEDEAAGYYLEKEKIYRQMYKKDIAAIAGLIPFLQELHDHNILTAIATSGIQVNIDFMFQHVPIAEYFKTIVMAKDISKGKPDPEIFSKAAKRLGIPPKNCVVFEDSTSGVDAGKAAGMKVVALTTTHTKEELAAADLIINDYSNVSYQRLQKLFEE